MQSLFMSMRSICLIGLFATCLLMGCKDRPGNPNPEPSVDVAAPITQPPRIADNETSKSDLSETAVADRPRMATSTASSVEGFKTKPETVQATETRGTDYTVAPELEAVPSPTPEQLSHWVLPTGEKLKLLQCSDSKRLGFATKLVGDHDGKHVYVGGIKLVAWSVEADDFEHTFLDFGDEEKRYVSELQISADGRVLVAGDTEGFVYLWNTSDRTEKARKQIFDNKVTSIALTPDGTHLAVMSYGNEIKVCRTDNLTVANTFKVGTQGLERIHYLSDHQLLCAAQSLELWNADTGKREKVVSEDRYQFTMQSLPDNATIAYATKTGLQFAKRTDLSPVDQLPIQNLNHAHLSFHASGSIFAVSAGKGFQVYDRQFKHPLQIEEGYGSMIVGLCWLPQSNLLTTVNESGRLRVWGYVGDGTKLGLTPLHGETQSTIPSSSVQVLEVVDLRTLPLPPGSVVTLADASQLSYEGPLSAEEVKVFYHHWFTTQGWTHVASEVSGPGHGTYQKEGVKLSLMLSPEGEQCRVTISATSPFDLRELSLVRALAKPPTYANASIVMADVDGELLDWEAKLLRGMHAEGWTPYARLNSSHHETPNQRMLLFVKEGTIVHVDLSPKADQPSGWLLRMTKFSNPHSIPIPKDAGYVEFDGSTEPMLVANTNLDFKAARSFYDQAMQAQGWLIRERGGGTTKREPGEVTFLENEKFTLASLLSRMEKHW